MPTTHDLFELASVAMSYRDQESLLNSFAARVAAVCGAKAVLVWLKNSRDQKLICAANRFDSGKDTRQALSNGSGGNGTLREWSDHKESIRIEAREILGTQLVHFESDFRSQITSALYSPIRTVQGSLGLVEVLRTDGVPFTEPDGLFLEDATHLLGQALTNLNDLSDERQSQLSTVERLTTLYDLGRTFTSSLELSQLLPVIGGKIRSVMEADACNVWLVDSEAQQFCLVHQTGGDSTAEEGATLRLGEAIFSEVAEQVAPRLVNDPQSEPGLAGRFPNGTAANIRSWMCAPLRKDEEVSGVIEVLNRQNSRSFTEDDLFFLASISEQAAISIHNAKLLDSERKVSTLDALLKISQELTSARDLKQVLATVANQSGTLLSFDRLVIGYYERGKFTLGAVSGEAEVPDNDEMHELKKVLEEIAQQEAPVSGDLQGDRWQLNDETVRGICVPFLENYRYAGFYGIPLRDEQGPIGAMLLLSQNTEFLSNEDREILGILTNQAAVAIRNAQLYERSGLRAILGPLAGRRTHAGSSDRKEMWLRYAKYVAVAAGVLVIIPWPLRVRTNATVVPAQHRVVSSIAGGVIERINIKEGDVVQPNQVLAQLNDGEERIKLAQAQAALETARRELREAEFRNDPSAAGQAKLRADQHLAEVQLEQKRLTATRVVSPLAGVVVTPKVEEKVGTMLKPGEGFAEIVDLDRVAAQLSVPEPDLALVQPGREVALKLNAFPTLTLHGKVERLGAQSRSESNESYFLVRAVFENPGRVVKDGMVGRARIQSSGGWLQSGWYPVGYVLLRAPLRWLWMKVWTWAP